MVYYNNPSILEFCFNSSYFPLFGGLVIFDTFWFSLGIFNLKSLIFYIL